MKWLVIVFSVRWSHLPVLCKKSSKGSAGRGTLNLPWLRTHGGISHLTLIWLQREKNQASVVNLQKFSFNRRYLRFPKPSLSSCLVLCSLACILALKSPLILRPSSLIPRSYHNCVSQALSLYWVKRKIKIKKLETLYNQHPVQQVKQLILTISAFVTQTQVWLGGLSEANLWLNSVRHSKVEWVL